MTRYWITLILLLLPTGACAQQNKNEGTASQKDKSLDKTWAHTNIAALAPMQFSEYGLGAGLSFEHSLNKKGWVSLYMPAIITFDLANEGPVTYSHNYIVREQDQHNNRMLYLMPGAKFYPWGMGRVKFAIGPSLVFGFGYMVKTYGPSYWSSNPNGPFNYSPATTGVYPRRLFGCIINNSLNMNLTRHLYAGAELGLGAPISDRTDHIPNHPSPPLVQGSFKIGYVFR